MFFFICFLEHYFLESDGVFLQLLEVGDVLLLFFFVFFVDLEGVQVVVLGLKHLHDLDLSLPFLLLLLVVPGLQHLAPSVFEVFAFVFAVELGLQLFLLLVD